MLQIEDDSLSRPESGATRVRCTFQWQRTSVLLADVAAIGGALVLFAASAYRRIWQPEWSGGEALEALWPIYLAGGWPIAVRCLIREARTDDVT